MTKNELRNIYKQKRSAISYKEKNKLDDLLLIQLQQLNFNSIHSLLTYWPIEKNNEPNTVLFSRYLHHMLPNLQIAYPITNFTNNTMQAVLVNDDTIYTTNQYGITEPKHGQTIDANTLDLIFVPVLCVDAQGYRVGYGKGFYDRYLSQCGAYSIKIGFSYFEPVYKIDDTNQFDVPLNYCITPDSVYEF